MFIHKVDGISDDHKIDTQREIQQQALIEQKRQAEAKSAFQRVAKAQMAQKIFTPADFWQIKGARNLSTSQQALLQVVQ